ncbi:glycosyltransferase family 2 protein [Cobetia amphilecti]|uniref:glycosyltransferase family 2 protein n=1 Tax=Cobetia amphilecti TaxID=1055104 RepID=UPI0026E3023D|nr:glycosyltransferase family 2 protein [Cobetia amphilecti]MDO6815017.1 glycosyltransferase family 2 protein [Cobetia amphilecti]
MEIFMCKLAKAYNLALNKFSKQTNSHFFKKAIEHSNEISTIQDNTNLIGSDDIILFCTMKNEAHRLEFFIDYYEKLGVDSFIFVDNASTDNTKSLLSSRDNVSLFYTDASYKDSNFGMHWVNFLLSKYGVNHWCLTCDPDEFIVYPHMETRDLIDLTQYLDSIKQESFFTTMLDMYSDKPVNQTIYEPATDPLKVCKYFDGYGYSKSYNHAITNLFVQGGVRKRIFSRNTPSSSPALNKVPLVKWKKNYAYISSMHMLLPKKLNRCIDERMVTGALLHFKFISQLDNKVREEMLAKQHYNDSAEYKQYGDVINAQGLLYNPNVSIPFVGWQDLARRGLLNVGGW